MNTWLPLWGIPEESQENAKQGFKQIADEIDYFVISRTDYENTFGQEIGEVTQSSLDPLFDVGVHKGVLLTGYPNVYLATVEDSGVEIHYYSTDTNNDRASNTTGAGDCTIGSFVAFYYLTGDVIKAFRNACIVAEESTTVKGGVYTPTDSFITSLLN